MRFSPCFVRQNQPKGIFFCLAILDHFQKKMFKVRPLISITFPEGFRNSKNIGHQTLGSGGKQTFKDYLKIDRQTDKLTYRKHWARGLMLWKMGHVTCDIWHGTCDRWLMLHGTHGVIKNFHRISGAPPETLPNVMHICMMPLASILSLLVQLNPSTLPLVTSKFDS